MTTEAHNAVSPGSLRRYQRRLMFGGGLLLTLLLLATAGGSVMLGIRDFHAQQRQAFVKGRDALDYFLTQRDRAYASSVNANDSLWTTQRTALARAGAPLVDEFRSRGGALTVRAEGAMAVPWLVLGQDLDEVSDDTLAAYLGMVQTYSTYTAVTITAIQAGESFVMYAYEPGGKLLAITGVKDEAQLLQILQVPTRRRAIAKLQSVDSHLTEMQPRPGPITSAALGGRLVSFEGKSFFGQRDALVGVLTMVGDSGPYFRRVTFDDLTHLRARLHAVSPGTFMVVDSKGRTVFSTGKLPSGAQVALAHAPVPTTSDGPVALRRNGTFLFAEELKGVDWTLVSLYSWNDLLEEQGGDLALKAGVTVALISLLWGMLLALDRRVFAPALADASRVYESEALSRTIIDTTPVGLCLLSQRRGEILMENGVAQSLAATDMEGQANPLYGQLASHARSLHGGESNGFLWSHTLRTGQEIALEVVMTASQYRDQAAWVCVLQDVTAKLELDQNLRQARSDAEQARLAAEAASRAKSAFVATMSHEIRTPLNGVLGHLELLSRSELSASQSAHLDRIRVSADALLGTISDVLDFSKIEVGQLDIQPLPFELRPLVEQVILLYAPAAQQKDIKLFCSIDPELVGCYVADAQRIRQILNNLLSNAIKFTEEGRVLLRVEPASEAGATLHAARLKFSVIDSGMGMSISQMAHLFEPFSQGDASISRRFGGTGLGLALCKQLAELLDGSLQADSTAGVGSVFVLDVPATMVTDDRPSGQPLAGYAVTLLSASIEWRTELSTFLSAQGATVNVMDRPRVSDQPPNAVLLMVGDAQAWNADELEQLSRSYSRVVRATPDGPLVPQEVGSTIEVSCYLAAAVSQAIAGSEAVPAFSPGARVRLPTIRGRVLLAEDNPVNRELIIQQLEELGYAVDAADNGRDALQHWKRDQYSVILTDINMPVMNGYELARAIRQLDSTIPIIAITATALSSERERCIRAGITDVLLKPMNLESLDAMLQKLGGTPSGNSQDSGEKFSKSAFAPRIVRIFIDSATADLASIDSAISANDADRVVDRLHAFKGALSMLGEHTLARACGLLEQDLVGQSVTSNAALMRLMEDLRALIRRFEQDLS